MTKTQIYDDQLIVITGACGFIAANLIRHLNMQGFNNLLLVDDFGETAKWKNLLNTKYMDLISRYELMDWLKGREREVEAFIHLGACSDTTEIDGDYFYDNNYRFSVRLAEYALEHEHRFIYASSAATYGMGENGFSDDHDQLDELRPLNMYGYSKHMFDLWCKRQGVLDQVVGLKYFNIFGPYEYHKGRMASMVYHWTQQIMEEGQAKLFQSNDPKAYQDGEQCRDFFYVKDAVAITYSFLHNNLTGIYNVGSGQPNTWNQLAREVFSALGKNPQIEYVPMPADLSPQYQNFTQADMKKYQRMMAEKKLKIPAFHDLGEGVTDYVQQFLLKELYG